MSLTPNFGMNIPDATDIVNLLTQCYPNFTLLDTILKGIKDTGVTTASETKSGTVHQLVRTDTDCNTFRFTATSNFATGDSFTVDGTPVTGVAVNGASLQTGDFVINSNVLAILNGGVLTLFAGGNAAPAASDVSYDNTGSGLTATDVQNAIDEVVADIPTSMAANAITYDNSGSGLVATDVQDAIDEINGKFGKFTTLLTKTQFTNATTSITLSDDYTNYDAIFVQCENAASGPRSIVGSFEVLTDNYLAAGSAANSQYGFTVQMTTGTNGTVANFFLGGGWVALYVSIFGVKF